MDAVRRELNGQIDQATQRLLDDARIIPEGDLRAPSLLPGWTRAHVLAHVARSADAIRNLLVAVRSGQDRAAYPSADAREAGIGQGAAMRTEDLLADLADSAMALRTIVKQLPDQAWQIQVRVLDSDPFPAAGLLTRRLVEVELHHCDLACGYSPADWPAAFATMDLPEPMRSQREDRLRYPAPSPEAKPAFRGRPPAPWKPGQRLPGSWLGTRPDRGALRGRDDLAHHAVVLALGALVIEARLLEHAAGAAVEEGRRDLLSLRVLRVGLHDPAACLRDQVQGSADRDGGHPFAPVMAVYEDAGEAIVGRGYQVGLVPFR
jgi:maleylpyruvate isomerase